MNDMNLQYKLVTRYTWKILTDEGSLLDPCDDWGNYHPLSDVYETREHAVSDYERYVEKGYNCPNSMVLIEVYRKVIDFGD